MHLQRPNLHRWLIACLVLLLVSCQTTQSDTVSRTEATDEGRDRAQLFEIDTLSGMHSSVVRIYNPWQGATDVRHVYLVHRAGEAIPDSLRGQARIIPASPQRIVCMSTTHIALLDKLGYTDRIVGVSGLGYVHNSTIHERGVVDVGEPIDYETLLSLKPDLVMLYGVDNARSSVTERLDALGIPYIMLAEYLESSPLARAQWLELVGEVMAETSADRARAHALYTDLVDAYRAERRTLAIRPSVMFNAPWADSWQVPAPRSYMSTFVTDAGGYYWVDELDGVPEHQPYALSFEEAYIRLGQSDYWLNPGMVSSRSDLSAIDERLASLPIVVEGRTYNSNKRQTPMGGNDYYESGLVNPHLILRDLRLILSGQGVADSLTYYRRVE